MQQTEGWRCHHSSFQASCLTITVLCSFWCSSNALSHTALATWSITGNGMLQPTILLNIFQPAIVKSPCWRELKDCLPLSQVNQKCGGRVRTEKLMTRPKHYKGAGLRQHRKERGKENKNPNQTWWPQVLLLYSSMGCCFHECHLMN